MTGRRIVSIWFPQLAMERWRKAHSSTDETVPRALASEGPHGMVIDAVNQAARKAGAKEGQRFTDARAICPALLVEPSDHDGDAYYLTRLGYWTQRWGPWTAVDGTDGLLLDSTGTAHCFGGETAMLHEIEDRFDVLGFSCRTAIAPTAGGAWALAHFSSKNQISADRQTLAKALAPLPIESLKIDGNTALLLRQLGLKTIGALAEIPTTALARRFRKHKRQISNPLRRLQQVLGTVEEVVEPLAPQTTYRAAQRVAEPVQYVAILEPILTDLVKRLCCALETGQRGLRRVRFEAFRVDGYIAQVEIETAAPVRSPGHIVRLFGGKLETLEAGFGFDAFALTAIWHEMLMAQQQGLEDEQAEGIALPHLLDRLRVRLGSSNVSVPVPYASHVPERSLIWQNETSALPFASGPERDRPIRLFDRPELVTVIYATPDGPPRRFRWRHRLHDVAKTEGPERIAPEWWREKSSVRLRDYYKVEDREGRRFWIYRNGVIDDGRGGPPQWFMHGLFV